MNSSLLTNIESKLKRANDHIQRLSVDIPKWSNENPAKCDCVLNEGRLGFKLILDEFEKPESLNDWSLSVGECVHNLRSLLDNLTFALARLKQDPPANPRSIKFPIYQEEAQFRNGSSSTIRQLTTDVAELIEKTQPFQRNNPNVEGTPADDPLVILNWLSNIDKHQIPIVIHLFPNSIANSARVEYYSEEEASLNVPPNVSVWVDNFTPGTTLMEYKSKHPIKKVSGSFNYIVTVSIDVKGTLLPVMKLMPYLIGYTNLVLDQFRNFFV